MTAHATAATSRDPLMGQPYTRALLPVDQEALERPAQSVRPSGDVLEAHEPVRQRGPRAEAFELLVGDRAPDAVHQVRGVAGDVACAAFEMFRPEAQPGRAGEA